MANLFALCYARMFDAAARDGYFASTILSVALQECIKWLAPRCSVTSLPWSTMARSPSSTRTPRGISLTQWAAITSGAAATLQGELETLLVDPIKNPNYFFLCWSPKKAGEALHDMHIREFAWEFLL
jgi:hypothetical protein